MQSVDWIEKDGKLCRCGCKYLMKRETIVSLNEFIRDYLVLFLANYFLFCKNNKMKNMFGGILFVLKMFQFIILNLLKFGRVI